MRDIAAALATGVCVIAIAQPAQAQVQTQDYDISAGSLKAALDQYIRQSGRQVIYRVDDIEGARSQGAKGRMSADAALEAILARSGFKAQVDETGAVALVSVTTVADAAINTDTYGSQQIVVTGTLIEGADVAAPTIGFTREDLAESGFSTVEEVFESLPQNLGEISAASAGSTGTARIASSNTQRASGISLRGLGPQSTLVLLNGKRRPGNIAGRVFDISAIPLSVVERVDIVTGGFSATYGTDAVAGVVNLVTRRAFNGAETQIYYGQADHGGERLQASQVVGIDGERGGFVAAYDYARDWGFDLVTDTDVSRSPSPLGVTLERYSLIPDRRRHALFFSGSYEFSDSVEVYGDTLYSDNKNQAILQYSAPFTSGSISQITDTDSQQYSGTLGVRFNVSDTWSLDFSGLHGVVDNHEISTLSNRGPSGADTEATLSSISALAEGELFSLGASPIKAAFGAEIREESYEALPFDPAQLANSS